MPDAFTDEEEGCIVSRLNVIRTLVGLMVLIILMVLLAFVGWYTVHGGAPEVVGPREWHHRPIDFVVSAFAGAFVASGAAILFAGVVALSLKIGTVVVGIFRHDWDQ